MCELSGGDYFVRFQYHQTCTCTVSERTHGGTAHRKDQRGKYLQSVRIKPQKFLLPFKDKYELINWIYYTEFVEKAIEKQFDTSWNLFEEMCSYFYENRDFYNKTFRVEGQNSFSEYFFSLIFSIMSAHLADIFKDEPSVDPYAEFYTDALVCAIKKWLSKKDAMLPDEFCRFVRIAVMRASREVTENPEFTL